VFNRNFRCSSTKNSVDFCYFTQLFVIKIFKGTCSSVEMLKGYMVRERLGILVLMFIQLFTIFIVSYLMLFYIHSLILSNTNILLTF